MSNDTLELYKEVIYADKVYDVDFKGVSMTLYEEIERLKNVIKRITEINNQKIKIINDIIEYMKTNVNVNINHIYEILEGNEIDEKI